ncbi:multiheme c-type cytochrome [Amorphus sp. 3PC139-8]|uniref:multiheme c-type cytochrome n=1 Tax=Amorphus sp. 3PC139-8 TaxID=2735676 RepID=UPI00345C77C7
MSEIEQPDGQSERPAAAGRPEGGRERPARTRSASGRDGKGRDGKGRERRKLTPFQKKVRQFRTRYARKLMTPVELCLYLLLATGLMITEYTQVPWSVKRWALEVHIVAAVILFPLVIMLFWGLHRGNLEWSRRSFNRRTGRLIEICLTVMFLCGLWLLVIGEDRTQVGEVAHLVHLATAIPLVAAMLWHAWRQSLVRRLIGVAFAVGGIALIGAFAFAPAPGASAANQPKPAAVTSGSLILSNDKSALYSANFEGGSVSRIDRKTGERTDEVMLGTEIRTLALNGDETLLAATDHAGDALYLVDTKTFKVTAKRPLAGRPYGVVYDARNRLFWVTMSEAGLLYGIGEDGSVRIRQEVAATPRGLALMPDGRLLVTHALIGTVSIYDTTSLPAKLVKTIKLAESQDPDETVSQGLPRVLDRIVISPDLKQAWLPHHLWNFDHPFQFQSIVFPVVSVLWLGEGDEHEVVNRRKQLFKQINIVESGNVQRIVSNPYDAAFSDDGSKVYVTMAGSEDLVVFDLSRAPPVTGDEGAGGTSGANASQILALPGENPRGIAMTGEDIYVQNAMSLDVTSLSTGGGGPFAQLGVAKPSFAKLVASDPLAPKMRRGLRLFHLARTAAFPKAPMAGDNWMSCASCHLDGFNYTNGFLFRDTKLDVEKDAVPGHFSLKTFVTGDFVAEYIRMIRQTQGGMGFDTRFPTPNTDPEKPTPEVSAMMHDLHAYVTSPGNLPLLSTWLRADGGKGEVDHSQWVNSALCGNCHTQIFEEWSGSMHRLMGESNPYYQTLEDMAAAAVGEDFRAWCMGCHMPQSLLAGQRKTEGVSHLHDQNGQSLYDELKERTWALDEGTGCLFCHRVDKVEAVGEQGGGNSSSTLNLADRARYPGEESDWPLVRWVAHRAIRAEPEVHYEEFSPAALKDPIFCSTCHNEFTPGVGAMTTNTYTEWLNSPYANPKNPADRRTCFDCHMHADVAKIGTPIAGRVTDNGPVQPNYFAHNFPGGQYFLPGLRDPKRRQMSIALLKRAATVDASVQAGDKGGNDLVVRVTNVGAGHKLPTGVADFRELWLDVTVTDADGKTVLASGKLDKDGHLDPDARMFGDKFGDGTGHVVGVDFWNYRRMEADTRIPPKGHRDERFALPAGAKGPFQVDVKLMFRVFPQAVTDLVQKNYPDLPDPEAVELTHITRTIGSS